MNKTTVFLLAVFSVFAFQNCAPAPGSSADSVQKSEAPAGELKLDAVYTNPTSANTKLVIEGGLPSPCWSAPQISLEHNGSRHRLRVLSRDDLAASHVCAAVIKLFQEELSLASLPPGAHTIEYLTYHGVMELNLVIH